MIFKFNPLAAWVLSWCPETSLLHVEPLLDMHRSAAQAVKENKRPAFAPIFVGSKKAADELAASLQPEMAKRFNAAHGGELGFMPHEQLP